MASKRRGTNVQRSNTGLVLAGIARALRWVVVPCLGIGLFLWFAATFASLHSARSVATSEGFVTLTLQSRATTGELAERPSWKETAIALRQARSAPKPAEAAGQDRPVAEKTVVAVIDPFAEAVAGAALSREKLHSAFASAGLTIGQDNILTEETTVLDLPGAERFHRIDEELAPEGMFEMASASILDPAAPLALAPIGVPGELAYAEAKAGPDGPMELALASLPLDEIDAADQPSETVVAMREPAPDPAATQSSQRQPEPRQAERNQRERTAPVLRSPRAGPAGSKPEPSGRQEALAYARPDNPTNAFKKLFKETPKAGDKVAIYDISAAVVYMPDGTKLEAHSGIGKMVDNPRYVHVKNNGPTPPNTYKLSMREKRFHGVEAIRMTPIGKETMHGRDGILAHSYLLRGGRAESHGCVAFKHYDRFLKAFKQGKVTHMIVVPRLSDAPARVRLVSNGRPS